MDVWTGGCTSTHSTKDKPAHQGNPPAGRSAATLHQRYRPPHGLPKVGLHGRDPRLASRAGADIPLGIGARPTSFPRHIYIHTCTQVGFRTTRPNVALRHAAPRHSTARYSTAKQSTAKQTGHRARRTLAWPTPPPPRGNAVRRQIAVRRLHRWAYMAGRIEVTQVEREQEWRISIGCYSTGPPSPGKGREKAQVAHTHETSRHRRCYR